MMNQKTRRLSKMPDEVRAEISPWFIEKQAIQEDLPEKIDKLDDNAKFVNSNLKVKTRNAFRLNFTLHQERRLTVSFFHFMVNSL